MEDLNEAGGVYAVMNELADHGLINTDCIRLQERLLPRTLQMRLTAMKKLSDQSTIHTAPKTGGLVVS